MVFMMMTKMMTKISGQAEKGQQVALLAACNITVIEHILIVRFMHLA